MLPHTENPLVLRTDFTNQAAWERIRAAVSKPVSLFRFRANVAFLEERAFEGITTMELLKRVPKGYNHSFIFVVDAVSQNQAGYPILVVDLYGQPGNSFRAIARAIQGIENNLSIANMDFEEFASAVDADGIFRGFKH
jgi:hypothetical protein